MKTATTQRNTILTFDVSRHDNHNVEIKLSLQSAPHEAQGRADFFLFLPTNVKMASYPKSELSLDFTSRVRLSLPESKKEGASLQTVLLELHELVGRIGTLEKNDLLETTQNLGARADEILKAKKALHLRELLQIHSLVYAPTNPNDPMLRLSLELKETARTIHDILALIGNEKLATHGYFLMLAEFLTHHYVQYLGEITGAFDEILEKRHRYCEAIYAEGWQVLLDTLQTLREEAANLLSTATKEVREDDFKRELHLLRIGQLKKFFHANLFVDVTKNQINRKFKEPAAATAAAVAALWATYFQQFQQPQLSAIGYSGISVLSLGVAAYVLKDRMKEVSRNFIAEKASRFLPDIDQELLADEKTIGRVREWLNKKRLSQVPDEIYQLRRKFQFSDAEAHLQEEVLHHAKHYVVKPTEISTSSWALQDSLRINLERYLKHLDDPYKELTFLEADGQVTRLKTHRIYFFYLVVKTQNVLKENSHQVFRIVIDKKGIQRVESMEEVC